MRPSRLFLFLSGLATGPSVLADDTSFTGPAVALGMAFGSLDGQYESSSPYKQNAIWTARDYGLSEQLRLQDGHDSRFGAPPLADVSWSWALAPRWVAGLGANLELGPRHGAKFMLSALGNQLNQTAAIHLRRHAALYALFGWKPAPGRLIYGKAGYHRAKINSKYSAEISEPVTFDDQKSANLHGLGLGVGTAWAWKKSLEWRLEAEHIAFRSYTHTLPLNLGSYNVKPTLTRLNATLGYRF